MRKKDIDIQKADPEIHELILNEARRQNECIGLIASENFTSKAVMQAMGTVLTNKYAEGYPSKRYYEGCQYVDKVESIAIERAQKMFGCSYANVQAHSGSQANQSVYFALLKPGDTVLGMSLAGGGHLTHGAAPSLSGRWFNAVSYTVNANSYLIDYAEIMSLALIHKPKLIIAGCSAYSRQLDFAKFREIADAVGAYLMADIAHIAGLVVAGLHPSPFPHAHVVTSTTHKTLRGPRGGIVLSNDEDISQKIDKAIFPGVQGGPLMNIIAAKAVAFREALAPEFKIYMSQVVKNAKQLSKSLIYRNYDILTQGTENHMVLVDLRQQKITGKLASATLAGFGVICNKNVIPFDNTSPFITSGLRLGTPACTTRGFTEEHFDTVGNIIADVLDSLKVTDSIDTPLRESVKRRIDSLIELFPLYDLVG